MNKKKFKVIKGKQDIKYNLTHRFVEAHVTNTRLMGVVGLRIQWETEEGESFHQFFHLDAEEYGIDDYISLLDGSPVAIETTTANMMGGLGGQMVSVNEEEAAFLIQQFTAKTRELGHPMPEPAEEYRVMANKEIQLTEGETLRLWQKLCETIETPNQLINYFIMRTVGADFEAAAYLSTAGGLAYQLVKAPSTLMKNTIETIVEHEEITYMTESLIDTGDGYRMVISEIHVQDTDQGLRIASAEVKSQMNITSTEAAFSLSKDEYITVLHVKNFREVIRRLDQEKPHGMKHCYEAGCLYTEFNQNNAHVNQSIYFLNDDVYGVYYITEASQLLVTAYTLERIKELEMYFSSGFFGDFLEIEERFHFDHSILYEFVHSQYDNFYEFLEEGN